MLALTRLIVFGFIILSVIYIALSFYSRAVRRRKLAEWWEEEGRPGDMDEYIANGLKEYDGSLRRKLILGVYIIPITVVTAIIYFTNFY